MPTLAHACLEMFSHPVGHQEPGVLRPAIITLGQLDFFLSQWLPVYGAGVLLVRRAVGDMAIHNDEGKSVRDVLEGCEGALEHVQVIGIPHPRDVPAVPDTAVATSSLKASSVCPSMVILLLS